MNFTPMTGWYYRSSADRTASWTGVEFLYRFLVNNSAVGPYAQEVSREQVEPGDVVQLGRGNGDFYHSAVITALVPKILVAAHTYDALDKPLSAYNYDVIRFLHIYGVRTW